MREIDVVRAWKDTAYRAELTADQLEALPQNPVGDLEFDLNEAELALIGGGKAELALITRTFEDGQALTELVITPVPTTFNSEQCVKILVSIVFPCPSTNPLGCGSTPNDLEDVF
jgi:mersacidin/lichenicidin family type 2 lantibiotic